MFRNKTLKVRSMGGVATPLAGQMLPTVSSPGRQVPINYEVVKYGLNSLNLTI